MADEKTTDYVLISDGCRHKGERYSKGDTIALDDKTGARLLELGQIRLPDDDPVVVVVGGHSTADEPATLGASQSVDDEGNIKPTSFAHPDQIARSEAAQEKVAEAAKPAGSTGAGKAAAPKKATAPKTPAAATPSTPAPAASTS